MQITSPTEAEVETLTVEEAVEYSKIDRVFKKFKPRHEELSAKIKRVFTTKGKRIIGPVIVDIQERANIDRKAAETRYPYAKYPQFYEAKPVFNFDLLSARQQKPYRGTTLALSVSVIADDSPES